MLFNQTVLYALRAMNQLSLEYNDEHIPSSTLAEKTQVPAHYLLKIMRQLVGRELVNAQKGHHGGFRLARRPDQITLAEVLSAMDVPIYAQPCAFGWEQCDGSHPCPLHGSWRELTGCVTKWAENTTLEHASRLEEFPFESVE